MASEEGLSFLAARSSGRLGGVMKQLDMLGRQAPEPDRPPLAVPPDIAEQTVRQLAVAATVAHRAVISYGRGEDNYVIALELAPDWELVDIWNVSNYEAASIARVVVAMLGPKGLKDYTGEFHALGPKAVPPDATDAAIDPRPARRKAAGPQAKPGRGGTNRTLSPAMVIGRDPVGPGRHGQDEAVVPGAAQDVQEARESGG